jgi:hypothetical protein
MRRGRCTETWIAGSWTTENMSQDHPLTRHLPQGRRQDRRRVRPRGRRDTALGPRPPRRQLVRTESDNIRMTNARNDNTRRTTRAQERPEATWTTSYNGCERRTHADLRAKGLAMNKTESKHGVGQHWAASSRPSQEARRMAPEYEESV